MKPSSLAELLLAQHGPPPARRRGPPSVRARRWDWTVRLLALDPGAGTTGWALFAEGSLREGGQVPAAGEAGMKSLEELINRHLPAIVVCEEYRVYPHKAKTHVNSTLPVSRLIGCLEYLCMSRGIPVVFQSAATGKSFWTDKRLKEVGLYRAGQPHYCDAVRHGCHFLLFGKAL